MRARVSAAAAAIVLAGCGYVGDPLPPALNIPVPVDGLKVRQIADRVTVEFSLSPYTTEGLSLKSLDPPEILVGPAAAWPEGGRRIESAAAVPGPVAVAFPVGDWLGREIVVGVRAVSGRGKPSEWAKSTLRVIAPLAAPGSVRAESAPAGVRLSWASPDAPPGIRYRIARDPDPPQALAADKPELLDTTAEFGKPYTYRVVAELGGAESAPSEAVRIVPADKFPPAVPNGLMALAGIGAIELTWDPSVEGDFKTYRVYRASAGSPAALAAETATPAYTDRQAESGRRYRYAVSAVDQKDNESARSPAVEAALP